MTAADRDALRQRADYTHKHNLQTGRHGWLRLTPAYSVKIVEELVNQYERPLRIFDPFAGTSTTALSAAYHGHEGVTIDVNPFLVWFGGAKTARYQPDAIVTTRLAAEHALDAVEAESVAPVATPPIYNVERWWRLSTLRFLRFLRAAIDDATEPDSPERSLLLVAFCRTLIKCSNAAFNHQSMSFRADDLPEPAGFALRESYEVEIQLVLRGAAENPSGTARVFLGDARDPAGVAPGPFDLVITSPPYANRMSYIRELRPYMYWLGFLAESREAGELDWTAIGGTWGIATSRLTGWRPAEDRFVDDHLETVVDRIAQQDNKSGKVLSNYIARYFDDMWTHFRAMRSVLAAGAQIHYIVGNSSFYDVLLPVEQIYAAMVAQLGFEAITCQPIRKRNSKKELVEFDVSARWPGR